MYFQLLSPLCIYFSDGVEGKTSPCRLWICWLSINLTRQHSLYRILQCVTFFYGINWENLTYCYALDVTVAPRTIHRLQLSYNRHNLIWLFRRGLAQTAFLRNQWALGILFKRVDLIE